MRVNEMNGTSPPIIWRDGNEEIEHAVPQIIELISTTARWVHPETFRALPVWYPENMRGEQLCNSDWSLKRKTKRDMPKIEGNGIAGRTLKAALDVRGKIKNWTVCHIWGYDDPTFAKPGSIVRDRKYYSCVGNMIWLPTPLKGFTDSVGAIKKMLRVCAFHMYGWACEHEESKQDAKQIKSGWIPDGYPSVWPTSTRKILPPGTAAYSPAVQKRIQKRKEILRDLLASPGLHFPKDQVEDVIRFWKIEL